MSACPSSLAVRSSCSAEADRSANTFASASAWLYRRVSLPRPTDRSAIASAWLYKWVSLPRLTTRASVRASSAALPPPQAANPSTPAIATGAIHRSVLILEFVIVSPPWFRVSITRQGDDAPIGRRAPHQTAQIRGAVGHRP